MPVLPRRAEATAPAWVRPSVCCQAHPVRGHPKNRAGTGLSQGEDTTRGSSRREWRSGHFLWVCQAHRGETLMATWPAPGPSSWPELPPNSWDHCCGWGHCCGWDPDPAWGLASHVLSSKPEWATGKEHQETLQKRSP